MRYMGRSSSRCCLWFPFKRSFGEDWDTALSGKQASQTDDYFIWAILRVWKPGTSKLRDGKKGELVRMNDRERLIQLKETSGMNWKEFAEYFEIPYRTMQDWEHGRRAMPHYLLQLMEYKLRMESIVRKEAHKREGSPQ